MKAGTDRLHIFLAHGLGLLMLLPFAYHRGRDPFTNFANEWLAFLIGILLIMAYLFFLKPRSIKMPLVGLLPLSLALLIALQMLTNSNVALAGAQLAILYLLWAAFIMIIAAHARQVLGSRCLTDSLSWYLLAGGLWNVWSESNHFNISISNYSIEINPELLGVGSVGQRNHLCDYVFLSCCSLFYLFARKLVGWRMLTLALVLLSVELALSGARSGFLYWLTTGFLVWVWRSMPDKIAYKRLLQSYLLFTVLFLFSQYLNSLISIWGGHASSIIRLEASMQESNGVSNRLLFWQEAWRIFCHYPWLGVGFGESDWAIFQHSQFHSHAGINTRVEHVHNLFLQILAELGIAGFLLVLVFGGLWLKQLWQNEFKPREINTWWLLALLTILSIHSMLEYPLWYSQFLGIFAVLTGSNDKRLYTLPLSRITHSTLCLIPVLGLFLLFNTGTSFLALEKFFEAARLGQPTPGDVQELVPISNGGLLKDTGIKYFAVMFKLDSKQYEERMGIVEKAMRMEPIPPLLYKQAAYLAYSGKHEEALKQFRMAVSSFPSYLSNFKAQVASLSASDQEKLAFLFADPSAQQILAH